MKIKESQLKKLIENMVKETMDYSVDTQITPKKLMVNALDDIDIIMGNIQKVLDTAWQLNFPLYGELAESRVKFNNILRNFQLWCEETIDENAENNKEI